MSFISRAFRGRPRDQGQAGRLPPGQYLVRDFPVLSAGPTPRTPLTSWTFSITGEVDKLKPWTWDEFSKLPTETITRDIHCVTKWSKLDTTVSTVGGRGRDGVRSVWCAGAGLVRFELARLCTVPRA